MGARAVAAVGLRRVLDPRVDRVLVLSAPFPGHRSRTATRQARAAGEVARDRVPAVGAVQYRFFWRRIRDPVVAGAVAVPPLQSVGSDGWCILLRGGIARLVF